MISHLLQIIYVVLLVYLYYKSRWDSSNIERLNIAHSEIFSKYTQAEKDLAVALERLSQREKELEETKSSRKSTEVRTGQIVETWAPFISSFEYNPKDARFIGNPIDYVIFSKDNSGKINKIVILEIKSGDGKLSKPQREIKEAIKAGKVYFEEINVK